MFSAPSLTHLRCPQCSQACRLPLATSSVRILQEMPQDQESSAVSHSIVMLIRCIRYQVMAMIDYVP